MFLHKLAEIGRVAHEFIILVVFAHQSVNDLALVLVQLHHQTVAALSTSAATNKSLLELVNQTMIAVHQGYQVILVPFREV